MFPDETSNRALLQKRPISVCTLHETSHSRMKHVPVSSEKKRARFASWRCPCFWTVRIAMYGVATISRLLKIIGVFGRI